MSDKKNKPNLADSTLKKEENLRATKLAYPSMKELINRISKNDTIERSYGYRDKLEDFSSINFDRKIQLEDEINKLKARLSTTIKDFEKEKLENKEKLQDLHKLLDELNSKEKINHILPRIHEIAREKLFTDVDFKSKFENGKSYDTVVISIDIRRSTELMLKARKPELFSKFITELSEKLSEAIIANFGVFDKFTGDGILAFFPKFYSGEKAVIRALKAAQLCHDIFVEHYNNSRDCFNVFIKDVGLGIGVDYGNVTLVNTNNELTVVGIPVVYACRMSSAKAGETLLNQPAKEELQKQCLQNVKIIESEINIKNEGIALAYKIEFTADIDVGNDFGWNKQEVNKQSSLS